ncbi:hypothetical protein [Tenacibaculum ovolyticum]|uniref:hypothetical protein n=1 Tax=Tenacibaculum ovolyticum TaxID=104270 RepID=UPI003BA9892E
MNKIGIYFLFICLLISCKKDFEINIIPKKRVKNKIRTEIKTNFPENTIFSITAERLYKRKKNSKNYGGTHFFSRNYPVKNGIIEFSFEINDSRWIESYNEYRRNEKKLGSNNKELTEIDFESIQDSLQISVLYNSEFERDEKVMGIIGKNGSNLSGNGTIERKNIFSFKKNLL